MHQGNWTCSKCEGAIKELPFEPRSSEGLTCRDCLIKGKNGQDNSAPSPATSDEAPPFDPTEGSLATEPAPPPPDMDGAKPVTAGDKKMYSGEWQCGTCNGSITELPFEPRNTSNLKCRDCFMKEKSS